MLAAAALGQGENTTLPSGFRSFIAVDQRFPPTDDRNRVNKMHCLVVETGLNPACAVFTRTDPAKVATGSLGTLIQQLHTVVQKHRATQATAYVIFLTLDKPYPEDDQRAEKVAAIKALADELKTPGVPFGLAAGARETVPGPLTAWGITDSQETVIVVYKRMAEVRRWTFPENTAPTQDDIQAIVTEFEKTAQGR
jgi:hypothetical protein